MAIFVSHSVKNSKFVVTRWVLSTSNYTKIRFWPGVCPGTHWGSLRRSPRPPSPLGRGTPLPIPFELLFGDKIRKTLHEWKDNLVLAKPLAASSHLCSTVSQLFEPQVQKNRRFTYFGISIFGAFGVSLLDTSLSGLSRLQPPLPP